MLSGRSPFLTHRPKEDSAFAIMKRIKSGEFRLDSSGGNSICCPWKFVSSAAKQLVRGLLTVDPKKRLTLDDLFSSSWIKQADNNVVNSSGRAMRCSCPAAAASSSSSSSSLISPAILNDQPLATERGLMQTFAAFHRVTREGGMPAVAAQPAAQAALPNYIVSDVTSKLALQRRCKQTKNSASSSASSSGCSSLSSLSTSSCSLSPTKQHPWFFPSTSSTSSSDSLNSDNHIFNARTSSRIHDYLTSLSQIQQRQQSSSSSSTGSTSQSSPSSAQQQLTPPPPPPPTTPSIAEAFTGVSYHRLLPVSSNSSSPPPVSITPLLPPPRPPSGSLTFEYKGAAIVSRQIGAVTRSMRKRRREDDNNDNNDYRSSGAAFGGGRGQSLNNNNNSVSITAIREPATKKLLPMTTSVSVAVCSPPVGIGNQQRLGPTPSSAPVTITID